MIGQSIAASADAVTRNGKKNFVWGLGGLVIGVAGCIAVSRGFACLFKWVENNTKHKNTKDLMQLKYENAMALNNQKSENRIKEMDHKQELKKELYDYKKSQTDKSLIFDKIEESELPDNEGSVASYDELVSGSDVIVEDLILGLRSFHISEDCGLIGRTQIGKTSLVLQYAIALASGDQEKNAKLTPVWKLKQPMTVLYFAFEQDSTFFKTKYGNFIKSIPNLFIEVETRPNDFVAIRKKIEKFQNEIGNRRLLVVFDNITKMKCAVNQEKIRFFEWLERYRVQCASEGVPITYLKVFHAQGRYKDDMPLDATTNYGSKTDTFFTQSLVAFGMCKGDRRLRYLKELKNKLEQDGEKPTVSVYKFAETEIPMYDYIREAEECEVLPTRAELVRGVVQTNREICGKSRETSKRGPKEKFTVDQLREMFDYRQAGFTWREILEGMGIQYNKNKTKGIKAAFKRHGIGQ